MRKKITSLLLSAAMLLSYAMPVMAEETEHEHNVLYWDIMEEPTCGEPGLKLGFCTECDAEVAEEIPPTGEHYWGYNPGEDGTHLRYCLNCDYSETVLCNYSEEQQGDLTIYTCKDCGYSYSVAGGPDHQHIIQVWNITTPPTCIDSGIESGECTECGQKFERIIPPTGNHSWTYEPNNDGTHLRTCSVCGEEESFRCNYTYEYQEGLTIYTCKDCGYSYSVTEGTEIVSWDFESEAQGWSFVDRDGDQKNWGWSDGSGHNDGACLLSKYNKDINVDNWAISPAFSLEGYTNSQMSVWIKAYSSSYTEYFEIYAGTSNDPDQMTKLKDSTQAPKSYTRYSVDLSQFAGESSVYVAIRHCNCKDALFLLADDVLITGQQKDACTVHDFTRVPAKDATCTENGNIAYYHCKECVRDYLDEEGNTLLESGDIVVPSLNHLWGNYVYNNNGTHTRTCSRCDAQETSDCTYEETTEGSITKRICSGCGHSEAVAAFWDFETDGQGWTFVARDSDHNNWQWYNDYGHNSESSLRSIYNYNDNVDNWAISPAFSLEGYRDPQMSVWIEAYSSSFTECFEIYAGTSNDPDQMTKLKDSTQAPNSYTRYSVDLSQFAGESSVYVAVRHCDVRDHYYLYADDVMITGQYKDACTSHDFTYVPAETATCTEDGNVAYYYCNTCMRYYLDEAGSEKILSGKTVIPALGHLNEYVSNNDGTHTKTCTRCGMQETADCTYDVKIENGALKHTCSLCGYSYTEPVTGDTTLANWDFENGEEGWIFVDKDEDGRNYHVENGNGRDGGMCLISVYNSTADVDNWAISPAFSLEGSGNPQLSVWIKAISTGYVEKFELYAGTSTDPDQMTKLQGLTEAPNEYTQFTADLSQFAGNSTVYIAIRHCNTIDSFDLLADDVTIFEVYPDVCDTHDFTSVPAKAASCTEDGNVAYYHCGTCGRDYLDENGTRIVLISDTIIPAGHTYGDPVWTWSEDYSSATAKFTCSVCGDEQTEEASITVNDFEDRTEYKATVTFEDKEFTDTKTVFKKLFTGHSLSLAGDICVNFYLNITAEQAADTTVSFTWFDKELNDVPVTYDQATGFYKASCPVAAAEMTYSITATVTIAGEVQEETDVYSVKQYADVILSPEYEAAYEGEGPRSYANLKALVLAMLDYGTRAQDKFGRNVNVPANDGTYTYTDDVTTSDITSTMSSMSAGLEDYGLEYAGSAVILLSNTTIRHYYKVVDSEKFDAVKGSITFGGESVTPVKKGSQICFDLKGVAAQDLDTPYVLHIGSNDYQYSVMDYVRAYIYMGEDEKTLDLVKSLYYYNKTADVYAGGENNG